MTTLDAHLVALDMKTGAVLWDVELADYKVGYSATVAPLVVKDKVIVGIAGAEFGIRGFIDAYDAQTGKRAWRFYTVAGARRAGRRQDAGRSSDAYKRGGGSIWVTGTYDPQQNLVFFGTGNPGPDYYSNAREGDNLYTASLVALDADTGKLRWHYQFTPHDVHDWDSTQVPVLADLHDRRPAAQGRDVRQPQRLLLHARSHHRQGDRREAVRRDDVGEGDRPGRPADAAAGPSAGRRRHEDLPRSRRRHELHVAVLRSDDRGCSSSPRARPARPTSRASRSSRPGEQFTGGATQRPRDQKNFGALRAIDPATGEREVGVPLSRRCRRPAC